MSISTDLGSIFDPLIPPTGTQITGFKSGDTDLGALFKPYTGGDKAQLTNYKVNGTDLNEYFNPQPQQTWIQQGPPRFWSNITSSSDGSFLAATADVNSIYISTDSGINWNQTSSGTNDWTGIACSSTGQYIVATTLDEKLYVSANNGSSWSNAADERFWSGCTVDSTGKYMAAISNSRPYTTTANLGDYVYTSDNFGVTWTAQLNSGLRNWTSITSDSSGQYLAATSQDDYSNPSAIFDYIYTSDDYGYTWTQRTASGSRIWSCIASSSDGSKLVASAMFDGVYISTDYGATWSKTNTNDNQSDDEWSYVTSSSDGTIFLASTGNSVEKGFIYYSTDSGNTWIKQTNAGFRFWGGLASSSDGLKLAATDYGTFRLMNPIFGYIYLCSAIPSATIVTGFKVKNQ